MKITMKISNFAKNEMHFYLIIKLNIVSLHNGREEYLP